jgi:uncharacterized protein YpmB
MVKSRAEEWREEHQRRRVRTIVIVSSAAFLLILFLLYRWYVTIHASFWDKRGQAVTEAVYAGQLAEVTMTEPFNGELSWFIVRGLNDQGDEMIVWVSEDQTIVRRADEGISSEQAKAAVLSRRSGAEIIRMTPGVWKKELCFEVYYRIDDIYYYDYIRFEDGTWMETLRLGK